MWYVVGNNLQMAEGDYGLSLPVTIDGPTFTGQDCLRFTFKNKPNGETILEKEYTNIVENAVQLEFTETETASLPVGVYSYSLDWYQNGDFMCNLILNGLLKVVDKT